MEPYRQKYRLTGIPARRSQAGITLIGFLILAALFGVVGYGGLKLFPLYMDNMKLGRVLEDVRQELDGRNATAGQIRTAFSRRFAVEGIQLPAESVKITQARDGHEVSIQTDNRTPYIADIWFLVTFDKKVEIRR